MCTATINQDLSGLLLIYPWTRKVSDREFPNNGIKTNMWNWLIYAVVRMNSPSKIGESEFSVGISLVACGSNVQPLCHLK